MTYDEDSSKETLMGSLSLGDSFFKGSSELFSDASTDAEIFNAGEPSFHERSRKILAAYALQNLEAFTTSLCPSQFFPKYRHDTHQTIPL